MRNVHERNVHERTIDAPADEIGRLLDLLGSDTDVLWPTPAWPPLVLDRPLGVGATGGHGPIRYTVVAHEPGRSVRFQFATVVGVDGYHELSVEPLGPDHCVLRDVLAGRARGRTRLVWPLALRWLHDALLEDLLDRAQQPAATARWSPWVRLIRRARFPRPREVPLPAAANLVRTALPTVDFTDAWQIRNGPGMPTDPAVWAHAIFRDPPGWVLALLGLRQLLVGLVGIERGNAATFDVVARTDTEALLGADAGHLDFRASVLVEPSAVTVSTVVMTHNRRGRTYLRLIRLGHPAVVRAMLRGASRRLAEQPVASRYSTGTTLG